MDEVYDEHWIQTFSGKRVNPLKLKPSDIDIRDIAHGLALANRFTGHSPEPYSVAQHSVLVSELCPDEYKLWGLLHDATEAYFADISRPVKLGIMEEFGPYLKQAERKIMDAICEKFGLPFAEPPEVKRCDDIALANEAYSFFGHTENHKLWHHRFENGYTQLPYMISCRHWTTAEYWFLDKFAALGGVA